MGKFQRRKFAERMRLRIEGDADESVKAIMKKLEERGILTREREFDPQENIRLADVLVSGGRGIGSKEFFDELWRVAELLGGNVSSSRANVASGWIERARQVGQTGKKVAPKVYIACGIQGTDQHLGGMLGSDFIIAINKNGWAPIFRVSDLSIVGDVKEIIPKLAAALEEYKAEGR